jgi:hypothetical protein
MRLVELARTFRSKNAGPLTLTLDLMFDDEAHTAAPCNPRAPCAPLWATRRNRRGAVLPCRAGYQNCHGPARRLGRSRRPRRLWGAATRSPAGLRVVSAIAKPLDRRDPLQLRRKALGASGQLGYGIPEKSLAAGIKRAPDYIGADMGSIDPGPYYLGSGELAMAPATTRADLTRLLRAARKLDIPLLIGTAGSGPRDECTNHRILGGMTTLPARSCAVTSRDGPMIVTGRIAVRKKPRARAVRKKTASSGCRSQNRRLGSGV